jgi:hypoxanthine phosphoribosyltransferase
MLEPGDTSDLEIKFSEDEIRRRLDELAHQISARKLTDVLVVAILKGSFVFAADLLRALHRVGLHPEVDFITLSSYRHNRVSSGQVEILRDLDLSVTDRSVLVIDDVLDSGRTLAYAKDLIEARGAREVLSCVLIDKRVPRAVQVQADFKAFDCDAEFVVGYGMDVAHRFRELPFVAVLKDDAEA